MDWPTFFADITRSLAWPAAVIVIVCLLRESLAKLVPLLRRLKYKDLEAEFGELIKQAEQEAPAALPVPAEGSREKPSLAERAEALLPVSPAAAVLEAWLEVESLLNVLAQKHAIKVRPGSTHALVRQLVEKEVLQQDQAQILDRLRELRNLAVHAGSDALNPRDARAYIELASNFVRYLQSLLEKDQP